MFLIPLYFFCGLGNAIGIPKNDWIIRGVYTNPYPFFNG